MNATHLHLLLNHFPIVGTLIACLVLLWAIVQKQTNLKVVSCVILLVMGLTGIVVYLTGEPAEDAIENLKGISHNLIEEHEEAATLAIWLMGITGISALAALLLNRKKHSSASIFFLLTFFISFICFVAMARTGFIGGKIRHPETNSNFKNQSVQTFIMN